MEITGKLALVTGGARRLGAAIVRELARAGAVPVIHYRSSQREAEALAAEVEGILIQADLSAPAEAQRLAEEVGQLPGEVAVWVNNASVLEQTPFLESDEALWGRTLQLTLLSPMTCCRIAAPRMSTGGVIINVLDVAAQQPLNGYAHHCVAKAGLQMLTRCLAVELAPTLRVCGVTPGLIDLPPDSPWRGLVDRVPLRRQGVADDIAQAVRYLAGAEYVTGTVLTVDGGLTGRTLMK